MQRFSGKEFGRFKRMEAGCRQVPLGKQEPNKSFYVYSGLTGAKTIHDLRDCI